LDVVSCRTECDRELFPESDIPALAKHPNSFGYNSYVSDCILHVVRCKSDIGSRVQNTQLHSHRVANAKLLTISLVWLPSLEAARNNKIRKISIVIVRADSAVLAFKRSNSTKWSAWFVHRHLYICSIGSSIVITIVRITMIFIIPILFDEPV
jgi:hypothetical protein